MGNGKIESVVDSVRRYTSEEDERLCENLVAITGDVHAGVFSTQMPRKSLLCDFHRRLFAGVRDHAGKHRDRGWGSEYLMFGPNRSVDQARVGVELDEAFSQTWVTVRSLEDNPSDDDYERMSVMISVWSHAQVVRIHPFEDGNGRTSRLLMNYLLVRLGLPPVAVESCKDEYNELLNHFFRTRDWEPLADMVLRLLGEQLAIR